MDDPLYAPDMEQLKTPADFKAEITRLELHDTHVANAMQLYYHSNFTYEQVLEMLVVYLVSTKCALVEKAIYLQQFEPIPVGRIEP